MQSIFKLLTIFFLSVSILIGKNHLADEESFYLQAHADNPVKWYPWGEEAFKKAKRENKLIFLSIGYSTCHWCHIMEKESFENREIADILNRYYVAIKVDREERPDLDKFYQKVHQVMRSRGGGWPLTIIMTPNKKPVFAATYIPPYDKYGQDGLKRLLPLIANEYYKNPVKFEKYGSELLKFIESLAEVSPYNKKIGLTIIETAKDELKSRYDRKYGGFDGAMKFPQEALLNFLIDIYQISKDKYILKILNKTLISMAKGGIYDQIEGGFFRYSTRRDFSIPHFEKMLYSNANLARVYLRAYLLTSKKLYKRVAIKTVKAVDSKFLNREHMLYFSASDADSNGVEGGYFLYSFDEALNRLKSSGFTENSAVRELEKLGITRDGNFEGELSHTILKDKVNPKVIELLIEIRKDRKYPFIDKKIITSWNSMYISAKLLISTIKPEFKEEALASLDALLKELYLNGKLYHQKVLDREPKVRAFLEDYAYLIDSLIVAHQITLNKRYLKLADEIYQEAKSRLYKSGRWLFSTENMLPASMDDSSYPSALATLFLDMISLATLNGDLALYSSIRKDIKLYSRDVVQSPSYYPTASRVLIRLKVGDILVKSKSKNLTPRVKFFKLPYPYLLLKSVDSTEYLLCKVDRCFKSLSNFNQIRSFFKKLKLY